MQTTLLSSKGQVIIPKAVRAARRWGAGTRLEVQDLPEGVLLKPVAPSGKLELASGLATIRRRVGYPGPAVSLAEMDAAVLREAVRTGQGPDAAGQAAPQASLKPSRKSRR